ncbi:MAG: lycopene cyclase domain-containing protein [Microbacteriaceae bacterium]|nr:lycopene cyclase domain-containing protein [Microbacteriaceae bacterium]
MTYWLINSWFLLIVSVVAAFAISLLVRGRRGQLSGSGLGLVTGIVMAIVLIMTAVFDNVMIGIGLVGYDASRISGVYIGLAPLEDFAYAVAAVILLPSIWVILERAPSESDTLPPGAALAEINGAQQ